MSQLLMRRHDLGGLPPLPRLPDDYALRRASKEDRAGIAAVLAKAFDDGSWDAERVQRDLFDDETVMSTFVVLYGAQPVATASVQLQTDRFPGSGVLHWVAADPAHRGMRLGAAVSLAVLHEFANMGCRDSVLLTDDDRIPAIKTYLNLGFRPESVDESHAGRWADVAFALDASKE